MYTGVLLLALVMLVIAGSLAIVPAIGAQASVVGTQVALLLATNTPSATYTPSITPTVTYTPSPTATATYTSTLTYTPSNTWTPPPTWTPSNTPDHPATVAAVAALQTQVAWNQTGTALWWTPPPLPTATPSNTSIPTHTATQTPVAVAALNEQPKNTAPAPATTTPDTGLLLGAGLTFFSGALLAGVGFFLVRARNTGAQPAALAPEPAATPAAVPAVRTWLRPWRNRGRRWLTEITYGSLASFNVSPRLASAIVQAWDDPREQVPQGSQSRPQSQRAADLPSNAQVDAYWRAVLATLTGRGLLRGEQIPGIDLTVSSYDRVIFVLDMMQLAGVPLEKWTDARFVNQLSAATGGCRVVVTDEGGLAIQIGALPAPLRESTADTENQEPAAPTLPTLAPLDLSTRPRAPYAVGIGVGHDGPVWAPLEALGHIMVSGSTGSGKSYFLRSLAHQLISLPRRQPVSLYLADRAGNVFTPLDAYQVPQLAAPVAKTPEAVAAMLQAAVAEMGRRERLFDAEINHFPDKLSEYNAIEGVAKLARIVVVVDEVTVLVAETGGERGEVHQALLALAAQGRKYGYTLVVAGQDFKASTFNTALTHQLSTRIAFKAGSAHESRVVLGEDGAETLRGAGHGMLRHGGRLVEFQGFMVEKAALIERCKVIGEAPAQGPQLSEWEVKLIEYALEHLDGVMKRAALVKAGLGSEYEIKKQIETWRDVGLIVTERRQVGAAERDVLIVSPKLAAMT